MKQTLPPGISLKQLPDGGYDVMQQREPVSIGRIQHEVINGAHGGPKIHWKAITPDGAPVEQEAGPRNAAVAELVRIAAKS